MKNTLSNINQNSKKHHHIHHHSYGKSNKQIEI